MQIKTLKERKALRDGYCTKLNLIIGKKEFTIKWLVLSVAHYMKKNQKIKNIF